MSSLLLTIHGVSAQCGLHLAKASGRIFPHAEKMETVAELSLELKGSSLDMPQFRAALAESANLASARLQMGSDARRHIDNALLLNIRWVDTSGRVQGWELVDWSA